MEGRCTGHSTGNRESPHHFSPTALKTVCLFCFHTATGNYHKRSARLRAMWEMKTMLCDTSYMTFSTLVSLTTLR